MRVQLVVQVYLKDRPKGFLGQTGETLVIGKDKATNMAEALACLIKETAGFYGLVYTADELNEQLDKLAVYCKRLRFLPLKDDTTTP